MFQKLPDEEKMKKVERQVPWKPVYNHAREVKDSVDWGPEIAGYLSETICVGGRHEKRFEVRCLRGRVQQLMSD